MLIIEYIQVRPSRLKNGSAELGREFRVIGGEIGPQTLSGLGRKITRWHALEYICTKVKTHLQAALLTISDFHSPIWILSTRKTDKH